MCDHKESPHAHPFSAGIAPKLPCKEPTPYELGYIARMEGRRWYHNPWIHDQALGHYLDWSQGYETARMSYTDEYLRVIHL